MPPEAGQQSIGIVLAAKGEVFLRSESGLRQVESGAEVFRGEELVTGSGSTAEVRFVDDTLLSQGADSIISLDDYVFDDSSSEAELLFKMSQGTFRMVTGKIAEQNPDRFQVGTPLATIGIRGTTIISEIIPGGGEKIGVEEIHAGKALLVQSISGEIRAISSPRELVEIAVSGQLGTVRPMSVQEFNSFRDIAPSAIQQEREIQQQREEEQQDDPENQTPDGQNTEDQNGEEQQAQGGEEGQNGEGEQGQPEGGATGGPVIPGEGVLDPGLGVIDPASALAGAAALQGQFGEGDGTGVPESVVTELQALAQDIFDALSSGDAEAAQQLLNNLQTQTDDIIDELITGTVQQVAEQTEEQIISNVQQTLADDDVPELSSETEGQTYTSGSGINYIHGDGSPWVGTENADYFLGADTCESLSGMGGDDVIAGNGGFDTISGGTGNDSITGNDGNDIINGDSGDDVLSGGAGEDTINGGSGKDTISGGTEDDIIIASPGDYDLVDGGVGFDTLSLAEMSPVHGAYVNLASSDPHQPSGYTGIASMDGDITYFVNIERVIGTAEGDTILGNSADNDFFGGDGADSITGAGGNDSLIGGEGTDDMDGGPGTDTLEGGLGSDILDGGSDSDTDKFWYNSLSEAGDTIKNFVAGTDKFVFASSGFVVDNPGTPCSSNATYDPSTGTASAGASADKQFFLVGDGAGGGDDYLYYDANGSINGGGQTLIATFTDGSTMNTTDIIMDMS
ncbi:FecR domain-containing protein [Maridesulfovibrio sp.]|uniref:FecR domain-containing protein n=1 Tax=unclassified Maridesulfovibrio TaxID=2794999 RepID=UPI003B008677